MGVEVKTIKKGDNKTYPKKGDKVQILYTGTFKDGRKFDSSLDRNMPFKCTIGIGQVIKGWDEGIPKISLGEKAKLIITSDYAHGSQGAGDAIPPNSDLIFEVELLKIN